MTNNFVTYYPRLDLPTPPDVKKMMDEFYSKKFGADYRAESGLIEGTTSNSCRLRGMIATIGQRELTVPQIAFFAVRNPNWNQGVELACAARVSLLVPIRYFLKRLKKVSLGARGFVLKSLSGLRGSAINTRGLTRRQRS